MIVLPDGALPFRSLVSIAISTKGSVSRTRAIWTSVSDTSSTAPAATAWGVGVPIRWRKRMLIPMRPAELGTVRLMNLIADCSTTQGSSGSGVGTAPRSEIPLADEGGLREDQRDDEPRGLGVAELVGDRAEADVGELRDEQVGGEARSSP